MESLSRWNEEGNDVQWHMHKAALLGQMGLMTEANRELERTYGLFPAFAEDPIREMRKYILSEETLKKYYDGLKNAGMQAEIESEAVTP